MTIDDKMKVETLHYDINANLGGRGWGLVILPAPPPPVGFPLITQRQ